MSVEEALGQPSTEGVPPYLPSQLGLIRQRMEQGHNNGGWYVAGELATRPLRAYPGFSDISYHSFYVAPLELQLEPADLNRFTGLMLGHFGEFTVNLWRTARDHPNGDMSLPRAQLAKETVGQRLTEMMVTVEAFAGPKSAEEPRLTKSTSRSPIVEETEVRVFSDPASAQVVFDYAKMMHDGTLDDSLQRGRLGIEWVVKFHELGHDYIEALKLWYSIPANQPKVRKLLDT